MKKTLILLLMVSLSVLCYSQSTKKERNFIREGNEKFEGKNYSEAEKAYRKALQENDMSELAKFNLATTYLRQVNVNDTTKNSLTQQTMKMLEELGNSADNSISSKANYDLGNIYYNKKDFARSIDYYKQSLRRNPDDDQARQNLRLAQKQLQEQQNNKNNQDNKKDKQENKKEKQDQNKNKDKNGQDQQKPQNQNKEQNKNGISKDNAEQILQTMQNEEKNTQDKVNKAKMQQMKSGRRTGKQW